MDLTLLSLSIKVFEFSLSLTHTHTHTHHYNYVVWGLNKNKLNEQNPRNNDISQHFSALCVKSGTTWLRLQMFKSEEEGEKKDKGKEKKRKKGGGGGGGCYTCHKYKKSASGRICTV